MTLPKLKSPGILPGKRPGVMLPGRVAESRARADLPEPETMGPGSVRPSIVLIGRSGAGKTYQIGRMLAAGLRGLILAVEAKYQELLRYSPKVIDISKPLASGKPPAARDKYERLMAFREALAEGRFRKIGDEPIDFIAADGLLEVGQVIHTEAKRTRPTSKTGEQNTYALWDKVAEDAIDFFKGCRDAAGIASAQHGLSPVGFVVTCGEHMERTKLGSVTYEPLFPGRKAPEMLPYMFEQVIRLASRNNDGTYEFIAHTIGTDEFYAKCPPGVFDAEVIGPDLGKMYKQLIEYYAKMEGGEDEK